MQGNPAQPALRNGVRIFVAAAGATCIANASWWMQPLMMRELAETRQFGDLAGGIVLTVEMAAMALTAALSSRLLVGRSLVWIAAIGALVAIAGCALAVATHSYALLLVARGVAGVGAGLALMMMNCAAALFPDPDKAFARLSVVSILLGIVIVAAIPILAEVRLDVTPFTVVLFALALSAPFVLGLPRDLLVKAPISASAAGTRLDTGVARRIALLSAITFATACASGIMWVFYALIGQQAGLSGQAVDTAISVSIFAALGAAGLASLIGGRLGRVLPAGIGFFAIAAAVAVLSNHPGAFAFHVATMVNIGGIYFLTPYLFGAAAAQDTSGRGAVYVGSAFYCTGAVGPTLGGFLSETVGMGMLGIVTAAVAVISMIVFWRIERMTPEHDPSVSHEGPVMALRPTE